MITLTDNATSQFKKMLKQGDKIFLTLTKTGCSGFSYKLSIIDNGNTFDSSCLHHVNGVDIIVDDKYLDYLNNLEIDYKKEGFNTSFHFNNPIEKDRCGCGLSFRV